VAKILAVDDQKCIRKLLSEMLRLEGYHVAIAGDPKSGMLYFRNLEVKKLWTGFSNSI
jgi:CheY-like chemotaxis protein